MRYYSTRNKNEAASFATAALTGLAVDGGLYVPEEVPRYSAAVKSSLGTMAFKDIAFETIHPWVKDDIPASALQEMLQSAYPFAAPVVMAGNRLVLELFHGPTAAFKDFGARFMARAFSYLRRGEDKPLKILVATSGDTGGAVADGFFGVEGITVTVLYPKGRVTPLQEKQIAGLGGNVSAIAVEGSFDDCQSLVKQAFGDEDLKKRLVLSSANSINIARLIPQAIYYAAAAGQVPDACICVPSGNFGNLTAGLYAYKMGAPIKRFIAATNINKTVPDYLASGNYETRLSQATLSNAMDVGAPSNFERMAAHFSWEDMRRLILGTSVTDDETRETIGEVFSRWEYYLDPHSAVGWRAVDKLSEAGLLPAAQKPQGTGTLVVVASTAHPAKFAETVEPITGPVPVPPSLQAAMERNVDARTIPVELEALKNCL
ncbi:MAG: threonine synthase [Treponema sp.]|nr:threonine synthase [Treponema sp.]